MTSETTGPAEVTLDIAAPPEKVYDLVADLPGMGKWSPENTGGSWMGDATEAKVGARFKGKNRRGPVRWSTICTITAAERGRELEWVNTSLGLPIARWRYEFRANNAGGTTVTESTEDRRGVFMKTVSPVIMGLVDRRGHNIKGMQETLARLKAAAERP